MINKLKNLVAKHLEIIREEQKESGRLVFGTLCSYVPVEILHAFDIVPLRLWEPAEDIDRAEQMAGEKEFGELFGRSTVMEIFAPFLIRDSMITSAADGVLSDEEVASAIREGKQLGVKEKKIRRIAEAIRLSMEALLAWKEATQ